MTYTPEELQEVVRRHGLWLLGEKGGERADLRDVYLFHAELEGVNLCGADLREANLKEAYCYHANLSAADLSGAYLVAANLSDANLQGANLQEVNLRGARLDRATLIRANLHWANLDGAIISDAYLGNLKVIQLDSLGSHRRQLVVKQFEDGSTEAMTGCFRGSLEDLEKAAEITHADHPPWLREYRAAIAYCRAMWDAEKGE